MNSQNENENENGDVSNGELSEMGGDDDDPDDDDPDEGGGASTRSEFSDTPDMDTESGSQFVTPKRKRAEIRKARDQPSKHSRTDDTSDMDTESGAQFVAPKRKRADTQRDPRDTEEERYFGIGGPQRPQEPKYSRHDLYMAYLERKRNREETEDPRGESSKTPRWYIPDLV